MATNSRRRSLKTLAVVAIGAACCLSMDSRAQGPQTEFTNNFKYNIGQSVQPVFEGWSRASDGSFNMHFGYLNRNWVERPHVPVGPLNSFEPGGADRGQPTYFYTRTQRNLFTVNVPRDWARTRQLVWTVTVNGKAEKAVAWLQAEWEIDPVGGASQGGNNDEEFVKNRPPTLALAAVPAVSLPSTAALTATVSDDGLPAPRGRGKPAVGQETPPTLQGGTTAPVNVPAVRENAAGGEQRPTGLVVTWIVWRGPADATFEPRFAPAKEGKAATTAKFSRAGEYVLRATASDSSKVAYGLVPVTVNAAASSAAR